jgi:hypothetical protein
MYPDKAHVIKHLKSQVFAFPEADVPRCAKIMLCYSLSREKAEKNEKEYCYVAHQFCRS